MRVAADPATTPADLVSRPHVPLRPSPAAFSCAGQTEGSVDRPNSRASKARASSARSLAAQGLRNRAWHQTRLRAGPHRIPHPAGIPLKPSAPPSSPRNSATSMVSATPWTAPSTWPRQGTWLSPHAPLVRMHPRSRGCPGSLRCDCGNQLKAATARISEAGSGAIVYMR